MYKMHIYGWCNSDFREKLHTTYATGVMSLTRHNNS